MKIFNGIKVENATELPFDIDGLRHFKLKSDPGKMVGRGRHAALPKGVSIKGWEDVHSVVDPGGVQTRSVCFLKKKARATMCSLLKAKTRCVSPARKRQPSLDVLL